MTTQREIRRCRSWLRRQKKAHLLMIASKPLPRTGTLLEEPTCGWVKTNEADLVERIVQGTFPDTITLHADQEGNLSCPKCSGTLKATVVERYCGCMLSYAPGGAYLDDQADIDTWENDDVENDLVAITCGECDFRIDDLDVVEIEIVPPPDDEEG